MNKSSNYKLGEQIFDVISSIERLTSPLKPVEEFGENLEKGALKYLDNDGIKRIYKIWLLTGILEIREEGRSDGTDSTSIEVLFENKTVLIGKLKLVFEDQNEWLYEDCDVTELKEGSWINEISIAQKRLDALMAAKHAESKAENEIRNQKKLAQKLFKRRNF